MRIEEWPQSEQAWQRTAKSVGGGVSSGARAAMKPYPLSIERAHGSRLTDLDGNEYIDYILGWGPVLLGHAHAGITAAVVEQVAKGATYGSNHLLEYQAAERLQQLVPGVERVLWTNTGSEATQIALRLARAVTGRRRFVKTAGAYHGWSDMMLVGYRKEQVNGEWPLESDGQSSSVLDDVSVVPFGDLGAVEAVVTTQGADVAAIIIDPVLSNSGVIEPPAGYLADLRELCDQTGVILIFDEVLTGFRIGQGGAVTRYGVTPDLVVLAKAIAGGYPLAAVGGRRDLIEQIGTGVFYGGTYNGNPVSLTAADAALTALANPEAHEHLENVGAQLAEGMRASFARRGITATVNQIGSLAHCLIGVERADTVDAFFCRDQETYSKVRIGLLQRGIHVTPDGRWYLSLAHSTDDVAQTIEKLDDVLAEVAATASV